MEKKDLVQPNVETPDVLRDKNQLSLAPDIQTDLRQWKRIVELNAWLSQFWIACSDEDWEPLIQATAEQLEILPENVIRIEIPPAPVSISVPDELINMRAQIAQANGDKILIVLDKFERKILPDYPPALTAHGFTQTTVESEALRLVYENLGKKIILVIHIGQSRGNDVYNLAVGAAARSYFSDGIIEIESK